MNNLSPSFSQIVDHSHQLLSKIIDVTPLQFNQYLSEMHDAQIWLKREDLSAVRSYKLRGAYSFFNKALGEGDNGEFVCASAGNHAQDLPMPVGILRKMAGYSCQLPHQPKKLPRPNHLAKILSRSN